MTKSIIKRSLPLCLCLVLALSLWVPAKAASGTEYKAILEETLEDIYFTVTDPICGSIGGDWAVLALARGGYQDEAWYGRYLDAVCTEVNSLKGVMDDRKYTEYSRVVIGLSSIGQDATKLNTGNQVYDLVAPLLTKQNNGEYWATWQGNTGTAFAIIALDSQNYFNNATGKKTRAGLLDALLNEQETDGSWSINGGTPDIDTTAMALQAMAPYYLNQTKYEALGTSHSFSQLQSSVSKALTFLKSKKANDYGSVEASAQVVVALAALDRDAANDAVLGDALSSVLAYYNGNGGFLHLKDGSDGDNQMSTEQAAYALVAYDRWKNGKTSLYDMTDRGMTASISVSAPSSVTVKQVASGRLQITSSVPCVVVVKNADGTYACLTPEGSGNTRTFHTIHGSVTVVIRGDANGDGQFDGSDITRAKAAYLGKTYLDEIHKLAADANGDRSLDGSDITKAKAAYLGKTKLDW
jgi:hypothetical protein